MVTIADVAERAGVSITTVSHVLSGKRPVARATQERIAGIIKELGFRPNELARNLRMQRTQSVALIIPDITNPYYPMLARGLQDALADNRYHTFLYNTDNSPEQETEVITDVLRRQVDGIVVASLRPIAGNVQEFMEEHIPFVSIGVSVEHPLVDQVSTDDEEGAAAATRYLLQQGYRSIGIIGGMLGMVTSNLRLDGYKKALAEAGVPFRPALFVEGDFTRLGGRQAMQHLLQRSERPTALFCANDLMAIGALDVAREQHIHIPEDIAIVGYDDIDAASFVTPALTTILNPAYEMGKAAGELLLERMQQTYDGPRRQIVISHQLIRRQSA